MAAIRRCLLLFVLIAFPFPFLQSIVTWQTVSATSGTWNETNSPESQAIQSSRKRDSNNSALIILDTDSIQAMKGAIRFIKDQGGEIIHAYPTHVLIGYIPRNMSTTLIGQMSILNIIYDVADVKKVSKYGKPAEAAVEAWNNNFKGKSKLKGLEPPAGFKDPPPIAGDLKTRPNSTNQTRTAPTSSNLFQAPSPAPGVYDTSEYFMGEVVVGIILPESTGSSENWDASRQSNVVSEIQAAMNWWSDRDPNARLTFVYDIGLSVPTTYEPITRPQSEEGLWIGQVMANIGYGSGTSYFDRVYSYLNAQRTAFATDWAFAIFVVDSLNDADGFFSDGYFAYAYIGGPFVVMTYDNDNYGIFNMDAVTAHETGHIFYAEDQYASAGYGCTSSSGYLNVQNQNSAYPFAGACLSNVASIMRGQVSPYTTFAVDTYARQQVGWRDSDGDSVMDILDFDPQTALTPYSPDPTIDNTPTYTGTATASSTVYPNNNPWGFGNSVTINKIAMVQYRIDSGSWISATASDGAFDGTSEAFTFTTSTLTDGTHVIDARAVHSGGAADSTPASDSLTIITQYQLTISVSPSGAGSTTPVVGSYLYDAGSSVPVSATVAAGYAFYYWGLDGANVGSSLTISVTMNSAHALTAYFRGTSSISLITSSGSITLGASVLLSGKITLVHTSPGIPAGTNVLLSYSLDAGTTWTFFMSTQTNSTGGYSISWSPPYPTTYQLRASWNGDQNYEGSTSSAVTVTVTGTPPARISLLVSGPSTTPRGSTVTFDVLVDNPGSTTTTTLYIEVTGPSGYRYFDTLPIMLTGGTSSRFQLTWQVPTSAVSGNYQVVVGLIPPTSTSFSSTQIAVT